MPRQLAATVLRAAAATATSPVYLMALADEESSYRPDVQAPTSSATGLFQFIDATWLQMVPRIRPGAWARRGGAANARDRRRALHHRRCRHARPRPRACAAIPISPRSWPPRCTGATRPAWRSACSATSARSTSTSCISSARPTPSVSSARSAAPEAAVVQLFPAPRARQPHALHAAEPAPDPAQPRSGLAHRRRALPAHRCPHPAPCRPLWRRPDDHRAQPDDRRSSGRHALERDPISPDRLTAFVLSHFLSRIR